MAGRGGGDALPPRGNSATTRMPAPTSAAARYVSGDRARVQKTLTTPCAPTRRTVVGQPPSGVCTPVTEGLLAYDVPTVLPGLLDGAAEVAPADRARRGS